MKFEEQFPSLINSHRDENDRIHCLSIINHCLDKQKVKEAIGDLTRLRGITVECQIHNSITTEKERILKELGLEE